MDWADVTVIQAMDYYCLEERYSNGISPCVWDCELTEERCTQNDTQESWTNRGVISEFKRATQSRVAVVNNFQK